jgi:hypothetical protein
MRFLKYACSGTWVVARLLQNVDPTIFQALEGFHIVGRVGEANPVRCVVGYRLRLVRTASIARRVSADEPGLQVLHREGSRVVEGDAILGGGQVFGGEPPWHGVMLHCFQDKPGGKWWRIALHHLEMEAAHGLNLP